MRYNHSIFIITYFLIAATACNAMKRPDLSELCNATENKKILSVENKLDIIKEITAIKDPYSVRSFGKDRAVVLAEDKCSIVDLVENKEIQEICSIKDGFYRKLKFYFHNQRVLLSSGGVAVLYPEEWHTIEQDSIRSVTFSPHEEALYFCYKNQRKSITKYNYVTCKRESILFDKGCYAIAMHPKEKIMCAANVGSISLHNIDNLDLKKIILVPTGICFFCEYSPDGSYIAVGDGDDILIVDPNKDEDDDCWTYLKHQKHESLKKMVFHPKIAVLAALFDSVTNVGVKRILYCWDIKMQHIIYTSQLNSPSDLNSDDAYDFDFSCDGSEFIIVAKDKCIRAKMPFEVIYQSDTKKEFPYHLFLLQQLVNKQQDVPKEIEQYCAQLLLQAFKR
jgi:WD40 repeat protein